MKNPNKNLMGLVLLTSALALSACGTSSNVSGSTDSSSRQQDLTTTKPLAYCNQIKNNSFDIYTKAFTDSSGTVRYDMIYLKADALPTNFGQDKSYISMYKWKAASSTAPALNRTPLKFALYDATNEKYLSNWFTSLRWSDVSSLAAGMGTYYPKDFFKKVQILVNLEDSAGEYDALKVVQYDYDTNKSMVEVDGLLPLFYADPTDYAVEADGSQRALVLQNLHPFKDLKGQRSAGEFSSLANASCF